MCRSNKESLTFERLLKSLNGQSNTPAFSLTVQINKNILSKDLMPVILLLLLSLVTIVNNLPATFDQAGPSCNRQFI